MRKDNFALVTKSKFMFIKKVIFFASLVLACFHLSAQMPAGGTAGNGKAPAIGHIYGKLVDSTGKSVGDASVVILQSKFDPATKKKKDVLVKGASSKANGEF